MSDQRVTADNANGDEDRNRTAAAGGNGPMSLGYEMTAPGLAGATRTPATHFKPVRPSPLLNDIPLALVESLRYLISKFQLGDHNEFPSRLAVTSALHGEGVTTISRTLAAILASDLDLNVCWVDLSWRPTKGATQGTTPVGIADVLAGNTSLEKALLPTADPRLTLLHGGAVPPHQRETFSRSSSLGDLISQLAARFSIIVLDTAPVLTGSAGLSQLRYADQYLLVVRHGVTSAQQIRLATDHIQAIPCLGVVLNRFHSSIPRLLTHFFVS